MRYGVYNRSPVSYLRIPQSRIGIESSLMIQSGRNKKNITRTVVSPWGNLLALTRCQYPRG
jgi:hypothetical protein